ncbi:MAG: glycerol-3-phosphate 1-O-acyltransferase PlsY [Planctomycetota bacterium]
MKALLPLLIAYAVGCISFAGIVARLHGVDVRQHGSGNPGATNVGRLLGKPWGRTVLALDILKGFVPVRFLSLEAPLSVSPWIADADGGALILAAAVMGHVLPVTSRFRGGKGVATLVGGMLAFSWELGVAALVVHVLVRRASGYVSLASVLMAWTVPLLSAGLAIAGTWPPKGVLVLAALALLITLRHAENFGRIRRGTESRHGQRAPIDASSTSHTDGS